MLLCKLLASLLLLLLAISCQKTLEQESISGSPTPSPGISRSPTPVPGISLSPTPSPGISPSPTPGPVAPKKPTLPKDDVSAVNALFQLIPNSGLWMDINYSPTDCDSALFRSAISCNCSLENFTVCRVTEIDLSDRNLKGEIPEEIGNLSHLTTLDLSGNKLYGSIPPSFLNLSQLSYLKLDDNDLAGPLPLFLSEMKSLKDLYLQENWFNGSIPPQFGTLQSLENLSLRKNLLSGKIPSELGNISSLNALHLYDNLLSEQLPPELGNLSYLQLLYIDNNRLNGTLPSSFGKLTSLQYLDIRGNNFSGTIPPFIANWQSLERLYLMGNNFEGPLPTAISELRALTHLYISDVVGESSGSLLLRISKLDSLEYLTLRNCSLTGPIPREIWQLPDLYFLDLSFNKLEGEIPPDVKKLGRPLKFIFLRQNQLNGSLPEWLLNLNQSFENRSFVDVSENAFTNNAGTNSSNKLNLFGCCSSTSNLDEKWQEANYYCKNETSTYDGLYINCGGNTTSINGSTYEADRLASGTSVFSPSNNGNWGYSSMGSFLYAEDVYVVNKTCNISMADAPLYRTARISPVSLKYYGFCLRKGNYIVRLHFAEIGWDETGDINSSVITKRLFDVQIQGQKQLTDFNIEEEAGGVDKDVTKAFNVSLNGTERLEIHLYWSGKGSTTSPELYGPLISAISVSRVKEKHHKLSSGSIAAVVGSSLLFAILILALCRKMGWLGGETPKDKELKAVELFPGGIYNFQKIKSAAKGFDPKNKLGEGRFAVYKGVLTNGTEIAVKPLPKKSEKAIELINEIGRIYALQHANLARLMGCCAGKKQLALVYEYMENKSLEYALFGPEEVKSRLNWKTRAKILLGVAKGLAFLHEECKPKILHGNMKPTKILLDKDFNAKISDFGYVQLHEEETTRVVTRITGSKGYIAPEYDQHGILSPKADVYSFGIVTLEIVSGSNFSTSRGRDPTIYLLDKAYDRQKVNDLIALVDERVVDDYDQEEAIKILNLAMRCVSPAPILRPTMSEVVELLGGTEATNTSQEVAACSSTSHSSSKEGTEATNTSEEVAAGSSTSHSSSKEANEFSISAA